LIVVVSVETIGAREVSIASVSDRFVSRHTVDVLSAGVCDEIIAGADSRIEVVLTYFGDQLPILELEVLLAEWYS
jgi:hypothetical protein